MDNQEFTIEQRDAIEQLRKVLAKCQEVNIKIAGVSYYGVFETVDSSGKPFISIS